MSLCLEHDPILEYNSSQHNLIGGIGKTPIILYFDSMRMALTGAATPSAAAVLAARPLPLQFSVTEQCQHPQAVTRTEVPT